MDRINLTHLTLVGQDVSPAEVDFAPGFNLICGPSDTGKTFILSAIDFALGAKELKDTPERSQYHTVLLGFDHSSEGQLTLSRPISGGRIGVYRGEVRNPDGHDPIAELFTRHDAQNERNISTFLLNLIGLGGLHIRRNKIGDSHPLSFRNIANLCIVDEAMMQSDVPPGLTGRPQSRTSELSTLRLMLGDPEPLGPQPTAAEVRLAAQREYRNEAVYGLIASIESEQSHQSDRGSLEEQLAKIDRAFADDRPTVEVLSMARDELLARRGALLRRANRSQVAADHAGVLISRFELLSRQYDSDLRRLASVSEVGSLLGYFQPGVCPFCGAPPDQQHFNLECDGDTTDFAASVESETQKTLTLRTELEDTLSSLRGSLGQHLANRRQADQELSALVDQIRLLDLDLRPNASSLSELLAKRREIERDLSTYDQIDRLRALAVKTVDVDSADSEPTGTLPSDVLLQSLTSEIRARLESWGFNDWSSVDYDFSAGDIMTGGRPRSSHGKGVRAMLHSAFTIGLAQLNLSRSLPHPGFVVLDSPIEPYRPADEDERLEAGSPIGQEMLEMAASFYRDLQFEVSAQCIVLETTDPPEELSPGSKEIRFSKNPEFGRYGFFPVTPTV